LDCLADPEYKLREAARLGNQRSMLGVPLMREGTVTGVVALFRTLVKAFTEKQVELVTTFADQAAIAIENVRLLNKLRDRQAELRVTFDNSPRNFGHLKTATMSTPSGVRPS
jgi:two-component system, NtrC family, sensor kinase